MDWLKKRKTSNFLKFKIKYKILKLKNENQFYWSDNTQLTYSNWPVGFNAAVGQQNNCVFLENKNSLWNTTTCSAQNDFICKITKGNSKTLSLLPVNSFIF